MPYRFAIPCEDFYAINLSKEEAASLPLNQIMNAGFFSVFDNEYTLVSSDKDLIKNASIKFGPLKLIYTQEKSPEDAVGVVSHISGILSSAEISILSFSSYARDAFLVPSESLDTAISALEKAGHSCLKIQGLK